MNGTTNAPVVVGVDGSASALDAVRYAAREAALRRRPLRIVHAFVWPMLRVPLGAPSLGPAEGGLGHQAEQILAEAVTEASRVCPETAVSGDVIDGAPAPVLLHEARHAALVVLGDRGLGGFTGLLVGSIAVQVTAHARCPVLVVRGDLPAQGPVVVGVDGSALSTLAINVAMEEAAMRGTDLVAVHAWNHPISTGPGDVVPLVYDLNVLQAESERLLAESLAGWGERYPEVTVTRRLVKGRVGRVLVAESSSAQLVVVGARGRGGFSGLLLGSVSQAVLHHSHCPLAIVRDGTRIPERS